MNKTIVLNMFLSCAAVLNTGAQDPGERVYFVPAPHPQHQDKPKVNGWAKRRIDEKLDRGVVAIPNAEGKIYVSWRLLQSDPPKTAFHVYRSVGESAPVRLSLAPVVATTDFIDEQPALGRECAYWIRPVVAGKELKPSEKARLKPDANTNPSHYRSLKFQGKYTIQRMAVADLNGDGAFDFVIKQPSQGIDPAGSPNTSGLTYKLEAYLNDGTFLWRKDLGPGIEPGIWYSPFVVYDFDGDGKAEVAVKTGPEDARVNGRVRSGPEWVSILDGLTGEEITKADWPPREARFGDYNRINRNQMGLAFLDGKTPCLLVARGTYKLMWVDAYQYHNKKLKRVWHWDGDEEKPIIRSQGAHGMHAADVDGDGRDEVILGSCVLDDNGTCLWSAGLGHPDKCYVSDIDPTRPGLEIFYAIEPWHDDGNGVCLVEAKTGKTIWSMGQPTRHVGDGMVADIDPSVPGLECFATEDSKGGSSARYLFSADGRPLGTREDVPACRNWIFWDGDLLRETIGGGGGIGFGRGPLSIVKYKGGTLTTGIQGSVVMMADILGDWREELITVLPGELRIYTTTIPAKDRRVCLMQDSVYRAEVAHRSMGYEQSPVPGYYLGIPPADSAQAAPLILKPAAARQPAPQE
jgi:rhamnogalacturonan endolyase